MNRAALMETVIVKEKKNINKEKTRVKVIDKSNKCTYKYIKKPQINICKDCLCDDPKFRHLHLNCQEAPELIYGQTLCSMKCMCISIQHHLTDCTVRHVAKH